MDFSVANSFFPPATHVIVQWACEQSARGGRDGDYACDQQHGLPVAKGELAVVLSVQSASNRDRHLADI